MGAIVCYDCTDPDSFSHTEQWIRDYKDKSIRDAPIVIVSCKNDLHDSKDNSVDPNEGRELAKKYNCKFIETSSHTGHNVANTFQTICEQILNVKGEVSKQASKEVLKLEDPDKYETPKVAQKKENCC